MKVLSEIYIYNKFISEFPNLLGEAFNLTGVIYNLLNGYVFNSINYKRHYNRYEKIIRFIKSIDNDNLEYVELYLNCPMLLIYNPNLIEKYPDKVLNLEKLINYDYKNYRNYDNLLSNILDYSYTGNSYSTEIFEIYVKESDKIIHKEHIDNINRETINNKMRKFVNLSKKIFLPISCRKKKK